MRTRQHGSASLPESSRGGLTLPRPYHLKSNGYYSARNPRPHRRQPPDLLPPLRIAPSRTVETCRRSSPPSQVASQGTRHADFVTTLVRRSSIHMDGEFPARPSPRSLTSTRRLPVSSRSPSSDPRAASSTMSPRSQSPIMDAGPRVAYAAATANTTASLARLPIPVVAAGTPSALRVRGMPTDQFLPSTGTAQQPRRARPSRSRTATRMFASDRTAGAVALLRVPVNMFGDTVLNAVVEALPCPPAPRRQHGAEPVRGELAPHGSGAGGYRPSHTGGPRSALRGEGRRAGRAADHDRSRSGRGSHQSRWATTPSSSARAASDLVFTLLELGASKEAHARRDYTRKNASQGEPCSHGFFYKPGKNPRRGLIGLPDPRGGALARKYITEGSASVLLPGALARAHGARLAPRLACVTTNHDVTAAPRVPDWYGNARPYLCQGADLCADGLRPRRGDDRTRKNGSRIGPNAHIVEREAELRASRGRSRSTARRLKPGRREFFASTNRGGQGLLENPLRHQTAVKRRRPGDRSPGSPDPDPPARRAPRWRASASRPMTIDRRRRRRRFDGASARTTTTECVAWRIVADLANVQRGGRRDHGAGREAPVRGRASPSRARSRSGTPSRRRPRSRRTCSSCSSRSGRAQRDQAGLRRSGARARRRCRRRRCRP